MTVVLWHIEVSHYNEKARWALDYKRIPHQRRTPMPGLHRLRALALTRGAHQRLPVIGLNGRTIGDSTAIIAALEEYQPDPPLYPSDPGDRGRALELEHYFDEELAPRVRRLIWFHTLPDTAATVEAVTADGGRGRRTALRVMMPLARPLTRRDYGVSEAGAEEALAGIRTAMERIEAELQPSGYLVGDSFSVADLTAAALATPLLAPPGRQHAPATLAPPLLEIRRELETTAGGEFVSRMYALHRGESAEIRRR